MKLKIILVALLHIVALQSNSVIQSDINKMFIHDNPKLIVDWTPKCGCTSVWAMLLQGYGLFQEVINYKDRVHSYRIDIYYKTHQVTLNKFIDPDYYKIKFVRNPYDRAVSSYLHVCKTTTFKDSFENFLITLKKNSWGNFTRQEQKRIKIHTAKQSKPSDEFMNEIIHIENPDLTHVNKATGLTLTLTKFASSHYNQYQPYEKYCGDKPFILMEHYPEYHCYYSLKTLQLVEEIYGDDIKNYNYSIPQKIADFIEKHR